MNQDTDIPTWVAPKNALQLALSLLFNRRRWLPVPRHILFVLTALPLALSIPIVMICLVSLGAGLLVLGVGLVMLMAAAALSRWFGTLELQRLAWAGRVPIEQPDWPAQSGLRMSKRIPLVLLDRVQWSYIAYTGIYLILGTVSGSLGLIWVSCIFNGLTRWLWNGWAGTMPAQLAELGFSLPVLWYLPPFLEGPFEVVAYSAIGVVAFVTLPWLTCAMVTLHDRLARVFLGRLSPEEIDAQMTGLRRSRQASAAVEGRTLRKLERDLHDGTQQQLVRLQLDLAAARRKIGVDPDAAARLIEDAGRRSVETLTELRHLVRGMAPPILQDRGLVAALRALAERNPIPASVCSEIDPGLSIEPAAQLGIYFIVAELLTNTLKHSGARQVNIHCQIDPSTQKLTVTVADDGTGGALLLSGRGLTGVAERIEGLGGIWALQSPSGGPTLVTLQIPI